MQRLFTVALWLSLILILRAAETSSNGSQWIAFPDQRFEVRGLPWFKENAPELWRLPKSAKEQVPAHVWERGVAPDGGRICFASETTSLAIRVERAGGEKKRCFFDVYIGNDFAGSGELKTNKAGEFILFEKKGKDKKQITIYLPNNHAVRVLAVGIDQQATIEKPAPLGAGGAIVCYGSSVLQGTGATHPSKTYPAVVARELHRDFVNLGFGGAGKGEPQVVDLVNQPEACAYIFDLGKSYGDQDATAYRRMLETIRAKHPTAPIFCVTPIYSTKEAKEPAYVEKSEKLRKMMREQANDLRDKGDKHIFVVEGLQLFGAADKDLFNDPLHPNDEGNERIAKRLAPIVAKQLKD